MSTRARIAGAVIGLALLGAAGCGSAWTQHRAERELQRAESLAARGRADDAIERLSALIEACPNYAEAHLLLIRLRSQTAQAVVHMEFEQKIKARPDSALLHFLAGYSASGPAAQAAHYRKALELDPDLVLAQLEMGRACRSSEVNDLAASRQALEYAAALRPEWAEAHLERARTLAALGEAPEAIAAYRRAIELQRGCEAAWFELACLESARQPAEAEKTLLEAVRHCPTSGRLWWHLADFQWARGSWRNATAPLERALAAAAPDAPFAPEARSRLAACYLARGWHRSARRLGPTAWAEAAEEMAAGRLSAEGFRLLRVARLAAGPERADRLQEAARYAPTSLLIRRELADALFASGSFGPAAAAYAEVLAARPGVAGLRLRCAQAELLAGRPAAALARLGADRRRLEREATWLAADAEAIKAQQLPPDAVAACHTALGKEAEARHKALRACIEKSPSYLTPRLALAQSLARAGALAEARAVLDAAAGIPGHPLAEADLQLQLGDLALAENAYPKAIAHYRAAIARCPELACAHGALAMACVASGEFAPAREALGRQLALDPQSYDLPTPSPAADGPGHLLMPRFEPGDVLRYRYSTDGGQPGRALASVEFNYVVESVADGHLVQGRLAVAAVGGRSVEGGRDFVGARPYVECSTCFGLVALDRPAQGVPREFAHLPWLVQLLHGPALPAPRRVGQRWHATAWTDRGRPYGGDVAFERLQGRKAHLSMAIRHERTAQNPATSLERVAAEGRADIVFDLARQVVERVEITLRQTLADRRGSVAELPPWFHRLELLRVERGAGKPFLKQRP